MLRLIRRHASHTIANYRYRHNGNLWAGRVPAFCILVRCLTSNSYHALYTAAVFSRPSAARSIIPPRNGVLNECSFQAAWKPMQRAAMCVERETAKIGFSLIHVQSNTYPVPFQSSGFSIFQFSTKWIPAHVNILRCSDVWTTPLPIGTQRLHSIHVSGKDEKLCTSTPRVNRIHCIQS
ncbi:hypothetical protein COCC4DRAFT_29207 [Bipolaris maydis ATCC 48331]|uniref:Uncharacterized protein n=2 Tax=Cochliobolus heterostrophus TaxID=5016 RepID=M2V6V6_COCH5|nr:uncharacterized protein COCC4DRAFT_29207 [Bipolaris maydis ATCC 48331]EMD95458.1 hypothetical protein COCHEDRAFT_1019218 [Bipolaris maydis C5]ENI10321.1 hypothetical protein COCC4DRAFT_29207 [Bipolaris maydis ATCC 48331]